jgi:hypothetical protein
MVNDLLDDNGCLAFLQSFDDGFAMELFSFVRGSKVSILAKKYTCINNIPLHTKSRKVLYVCTSFTFIFLITCDNNMDVFYGISSGLMWSICV